jgi:hypothetical protein
MPVDRRALLTGSALLALSSAEAASAAAGPRTGPAAKTGALKRAAVYVPGYFPDQAFANGRRLHEHDGFARNLAGSGGPRRMIARIGMDGSVRQALLPVHAHDVEIAPDRSVGVLCGFEARQHCAFDPETLDLVGRAPSFGEGWRGGGHAAYLPGAKTVILSERAPLRPASGGLEPHFGRLTLRDPETLKIAESYSTHGVDPHDIRLIEGGKYIVAANYGSVVSAETGRHSIPRQVVDASITVIEVASGKLVDKRETGARDVELRHLAAGRLDRIFAIQARLGNEDEEARQRAGDAAAYEFDRTTEAGHHYLSAATLKYDAIRKTLTSMGDAPARRLMRHGLSIKYDTRHDEAIATYPSSHQLMIFDGASGAIARRIDTRRSGLRYPCGIAFLPDGKHYAVTGYWENLFVYERGTHRLVRELCLYPLFFGHSHITAA